MLVALHKGTGFVSRAIQWQTRSPYSHASMVFGVNFTDVIEAREFAGVRRLDFLDQAENIDLFTVDVTEYESEIIRQFALAQVGKPYDYVSVLRFVSRRQASRESSGKWFCSELVFAAFRKAGINLLARVEPWAVSPDCYPSHLC